NQRRQLSTVSQANRTRRHSHFLFLCLAIERDNHNLITILARKHISIVVIVEIDQPASSQRRVIRAQTYPGTRPLKHFLLFWPASFGSEGIASIAGKAAGKVAAIVRVLFSFHGDLFAVVELRNATNT